MPKYENAETMPATVNLYNHADTCNHAYAYNHAECILQHGTLHVTVVSVSSTSLSSSSSLSASTVTETSQPPAVHFVTRTDSADFHMTSDVNRPPQLAMDYRRESQTAGESTANSSTAIFRPLNVPATSAFPSQAPSTPAQSTYSIPRGSAASLPANEVRILLLHVVF